LIHLYHKATTSTQISAISDAFGSCELIDMSKIKNIKDDEVYLVEIDKTEKTLLLHIKSLLLNKKNSLIYFFINDTHSLMLFQLASLLNVKSIVTQKHDALKIVSNIKKELSLNKTIQIEHTIAKTFVNDFCFMVFDSSGLKFASTKLLDTFKCTD